MQASAGLPGEHLDDHVLEAVETALHPRHALAKIADVPAQFALAVQDQAAQGDGRPDHRVELRAHAVMVSGGLT